LWSAFLALDLTDLPAAAEVAPADSILTGDPIPEVIMGRITSADPSARLSGLSAITAARVKIPDGAGATYTPDGADGAAHGSNAVDKAGKVKNVSGGLAFIFEAHRPAGKVKTAPADTSATSATSAAPADTSATSAPAALTSAPAAE
jgi:hypothetical protein